MKYFTPELLNRYRSLDDDTSDAAAAQWEQAVATYRRHRRAIRPHLPSGARFLLSRVTLHDAELLGIAAGRKRPWFSLLLRLEGTSSRTGDILELRYELVTGPHGGVAFRKHRLSEEAPTGRRWVLYDEFDVTEQGAFFTHSLLLADGYEIVVRFHHLRVRHVEEVLFPPLELTEREKTWPLARA